LPDNGFLCLINHAQPGLRNVSIKMTELTTATRADISDAELTELTHKVEFMLTQLNNVESFLQKLHKMVDDGTMGDSSKHGMSLLDVKYQMLIMYCSKLCMYIAMRANGQNVANHELLDQLAICCWMLDRLRTIQKQCQYSIDKLLDHAKRSSSSSSSSHNHHHNQMQIEGDDDDDDDDDDTANDDDEVAVSSSHVHDDLSHRPDLDSLRPPNVAMGDDTAAAIDEAKISTSIDAVTSVNRDGIYRPLKLNPKLMDTPQNKLTKKEERQRQLLKKRVKNHDIYQSIRENMTNLPAEQKFHLQNMDKFGFDTRGGGGGDGGGDGKQPHKKSKTRMQDIEHFEEDNFRRTKQSKEQVKKQQSRRRWIEASVGENLDTFVTNLDKSYVEAQKLRDFESGAKFNETIGKVMRTNKKLKGGKYIKGSWRRREKILAKQTKKGKTQEARKKWRKTHPLRANPAKAARMKGHKFKKSTKVRKLLKRIK